MVSSCLPVLSYPIAGKDYRLQLPGGYLRYSWIDQYLRCPQQFYRDHVKEGVRVPRQENVEAFEGTALAYVLERMGLRKLTDSPPMKVEKAISLHRDYIAEHGEEVDSWGDQEPSDLLRRGEGFLRRFWKQEEPLITKERLVAVEHQWEMTLAGVPLQGKIDLVERNYVWDYKVRSKNSMRYLNVDKSLQLSLYAVAMKKEKVGYIVFVKDDLSILHKQSTRDLDRTKLWLEFTVAHVAQAISNGAFPPCNTADNFLCSERWCEHWSTCAGLGQ